MAEIMIVTVKVIALACNTSLQKENKGPGRDKKKLFLFISDPNKKEDFFLSSRHKITNFISFL